MAAGKFPGSATAPHSHAGFTLVELMMGLVVMAILVAMALPAMGNRLERHRLALAAETLAADLTEARFEAARRGQNMTLLASSDAGGRGWCWQVLATNAGHSASADCRCTQATACGWRSVDAAAHPGVRMSQGRRIDLAPDGTAPKATAAVFESAHGLRLQVDMLALGRPRICSPTGVQGRYPAC